MEIKCKDIVELVEILKKYGKMNYKMFPADDPLHHKVCYILKNKENINDIIEVSTFHNTIKNSKYEDFFKTSTDRLKLIAHVKGIILKEFIVGNKIILADTAENAILRYNEMFNDWKKNFNLDEVKIVMNGL